MKTILVPIELLFTKKKKKNYLNWKSFNQISLNKKYKIQSNIIEMQMYG